MTQVLTPYYLTPAAMRELKFKAKMMRLELHAKRLIRQAEKREASK